MTYPATALDQAVAIEHRVDGAFGRDGNTGKPADQALADFSSTPAGVLVFHIQDKVFHLERKALAELVFEHSHAFLVALLTRFGYPRKIRRQY
jgi:hypothetical protein